MADTYATNTLAIELGYAFHTAFRKALPTDGHEVWMAIQKLRTEDPEAWSFALTYVAEHLFGVFPVMTMDPGFNPELKPGSR